MSGHQELSGAHAPHEQGYQRMRDWLHDRCGMIYPEKKKTTIDLSHAESLRTLRRVEYRGTG